MSRKVLVSHVKRHLFRVSLHLACPIVTSTVPSISFTVPHVARKKFEYLRLYIAAHVGLPHQVNFFFAGAHFVSTVMKNSGIGMAGG